MITGTLDRPHPSAISAGQLRQRRLRLNVRLKGLPAVVSLLVWLIVPVLMLSLLLARNGALVAGAAASFYNPFAAHYALMPGQPVQPLDGAACDSGSPHEPRRVCSVFPQDGLFHLISYVESHDGIAETTFFSESLQLGHLLAQWGEPDFAYRNTGGRTFTLVWQRAQFSASAALIPNGPDGYVRLVTVKATAGIH